MRGTIVTRMRKLPGTCGARACKPAQRPVDTHVCAAQHRTCADHMASLCTEARCTALRAHGACCERRGVRRMQAPPGAPCSSLTKRRVFSAQSAPYRKPSSTAPRSDSSACASRSCLFFMAGDSEWASVSCHTRHVRSPGSAELLGQMGAGVMRGRRHTLCAGAAVLHADAPGAAAQIADA